MQIKIRAGKKKLITLDVQASDTIHMVKAKIAKYVSSASGRCLYMKGKQLEDTNTFTDIGIDTGTTLVLGKLVSAAAQPERTKLNDVVINMLRNAKSGVGPHTTSSALSACWTLLADKGLSKEEIGAQLTKAVDQLVETTSEAS